MKDKKIKIVTFYKCYEISKYVSRVYKNKKLYRYNVIM